LTEKDTRKWDQEEIEMGLSDLAVESLLVVVQIMLRVGDDPYQFYYAFHHIKTPFSYINPGEFENEMQKMSTLALDPRNHRLHLCKHTHSLRKKLHGERERERERERDIIPETIDHS